MKNDIGFTIKIVRFDENYEPAQSTRLTTNFANLARGELRQENLRNTISMIDNQFNSIANWDNPNSDRYSIELDIVSVDISIDDRSHSFPSIEMLKTTIIDKKNNKRIEGVVGNNFSSYVRDYDFSVLLKKHNEGKNRFSVPEGFGDLHGNLFKNFIYSDVYNKNFSKLPVICLSVSDSKVYHQINNIHPILGIEYQASETSLTEQYFKKMGFDVRYFMPPSSSAPFAFYFFGDLLNDYTNLELISTISTMDAFQKIYRPEIYNANSKAGSLYQPSLKNEDYSFSRINYDREERNLLAVQQGVFADENFIKPHADILVRWSKSTEVC